LNYPELSLGLLGRAEIPRIMKLDGIYRFDTDSTKSAAQLVGTHGDEIAKWLWRLGHPCAHICVGGKIEKTIPFKTDCRAVSEALRQNFDYSGGEPKTMTQLKNELLEEGIAIGEHEWTQRSMLEMASWKDVKKNRYGMVLREVTIYDRHGNFLSKEEPMRQLALSAAVAEQIKLKGISLAEATRRVTSNYTWRNQESEDFWRDALQELTVNDPSSWKTRENALIHDTTFNNWRAMDSEIKLIQICRSDSKTGNKVVELFSVSLGKDVREIADPRVR